MKSFLSVPKKKYKQIQVWPDTKAIVAEDTFKSE